MAADPIFQHIVDLLGPALRVSLDPVAVVDSSGVILYANSSMRSFLEIRGNRGKPRFQELLKIASLEGQHPLDRTIATGEEIRLDELPAIKASGQKVRVIFKSVPLFDPTETQNRRIFAAILSLRDTTGEVLLQAKYHKLKELQEDKDSEIMDLREKVEDILESLRRHRGAR
ncbi:MAG: hypothetical protein IT285_12750 [Bdellovibrionales bacterium]|nr:hypothetical protein [Bdellovibrionales bacterium]